jgi:two-component system, LuxR family, sensor kinase FixL
MNPEGWLARAAGPTTGPEAATALRRGLRTVPRTVLASAALAAGYFLASLLGLSLQFPSTQVSAIWLPNAILLAVLLVTPRRRWWTYLAAVAPAHLLAQSWMGIPLAVSLINFAGNSGDALLGALVIQHLLGEPRRFDSLRAVVLIMLVGGVLAPALMSFLVAELFVRIGASADPWLAWRLRLLTNTLAVSTLVPPLVLALTRTRTRPPGRAKPHRRGEAGVLLAGLLVVGILVFELPTAGSGQSPLLLYVPLPFLFWAAMRFGLTGACLSVLTLEALAMWGIFHGHGPFVAHDPVENAASLVLFLNVICAPLVMLAALLMERQSEDERRLRAETLHSAVLASVHDQIAVLDRDGKVLEVNESWEASGRAEVGADYLEFCRSPGPLPVETAQRMVAGLEAVLSGRQRRFELEFPCPMGSGAWYEMSAEGLKRPEGGAVITNADITSRKTMELEALEQRQELAHLTRVATLGELSGALAHELNQPLTAILSNAQAARRMLAREPVDLREVREILRDIAEDDRRAGEVIQRLRAMLKKGGAKLIPLDLNELIKEVLRLAHSDLITRNVAVTTELASELPPVCGDRVQLQQVILNLILNACEAMSDRQTQERRLTVATARDGAAGVRVSVVDRGTGISADELERVFAPFFTTKEHGLGLGLSICRSIVVAHGGRLWASNNQDRGATFHLTLPLQTAEPD